MSLVPKVDEVREFIFRRNITIAFITETWLKETMSDGVIDIPDFAVLRLDRKRDSHGGVCTYIKEGYCRYKLLRPILNKRTILFSLVHSIPFLKLYSQHA